MPLGWVKSHVEMFANEEADTREKNGGGIQPKTTWITQGGLKVAWMEKRRRGGELPEPEKGKVVKWNRKDLLNYTQCGTGKGRLGWRRSTREPWNDPIYLTKDCHELETGNHVALQCVAGEWSGQKWSTWG